MLRNLVSLVLVVALGSLSACAVDEVGVTSADVGAAPIQACPIPTLGTIAGHERTFYECADRAADEGRGCGPTGYLLGYGARYAQRFYQQTRPAMSRRGQAWIDDVLVCLQRDLRDSIDETTSCDDIRQIAFDSHPACYTDAGFCSLPLWDILQVVRTVDARDWLNADAARQLVRTASTCSREYAFAMHVFFADLAD